VVKNTSIVYGVLNSNTPFAREGSSKIQLNGLNIDVYPEAHKYLIQLLEYALRKPCLDAY